MRSHYTMYSHCTMYSHYTMCSHYSHVQSIQPCAVTAPCAVTIAITAAMRTIWDAIGRSFAALALQGALQGTQHPMRVALEQVASQKHCRALHSRAFEQLSTATDGRRVECTGHQHVGM